MKTRLKDWQARVKARSEDKKRFDAEMGIALFFSIDVLVSSCILAWKLSGNMLDLGVLDGGALTALIHVTVSSFGLVITLLVHMYTNRDKKKPDSAGHETQPEGEKAVSPKNVE